MGKIPVKEGFDCPSANLEEDRRLMLTLALLSLSGENPISRTCKELRIVEIPAAELGLLPSPSRENLTAEQ